MIEPLALHREAQHRTFERYRRTQLTAERADHAIMELYRQGVINVQRSREILKEWEEPTHETWGGWNAWRMFNATTFVLTGPYYGAPGNDAKVVQDHRRRLRARPLTPPLSGDFCA